MADAVVPIVFPDYLIAVDTPPVRVNVPDWLPGVPNEVTVPSTKNRIPYLGHAGVLFFDGRGLSKYYEYGRYDPAAIGLVRRHSIPDLGISQTGKPTRASLAAVLGRVSLLAGHGGRICGAYIELGPGAFGRMLAYATSRTASNTNSRRAPYDLISNSCLHFMKAVAEAGGARMPAVFDPRPGGYIERVRSDHPDLDFGPGGVVAVEGVTLT